VTHFHVNVLPLYVRTN